MAHILQPKQRHYDVLAEGVSSDGRVIRRVEARADDLRDVAEAFRLAGKEARKAHLPVARVRLTASRGGAAEVAVTLDDSPLDEMAASALLDGVTKLDTVLPRPISAEAKWGDQLAACLLEIQAAWPDIRWDLEYAISCQGYVLSGRRGNWVASQAVPDHIRYIIGGARVRLLETARRLAFELAGPKSAP